MNHLNTPPNDATAVPGSGHEVLLDAFLDGHAEWQRWRTWSDETTHAVHESLALRAELDHEPLSAQNVNWRFAVYNSPVGERLWHASATASTPVEVVNALLLSLAAHAAEYPHLNVSGREETLAEATLPLAESGWTPTPAVSDNAARWVRWAPANTGFFLLHDTSGDRDTDSSTAWLLSGHGHGDRSTWGSPSPPLLRPWR